MATADPATLPDKATWYLATDLPRPGSPRTADSPHPPADRAGLVRLYGLRHWIEQSYKQIKDELGRVDFQVRSDTAIRRHQTLVNCAFSFCWDIWFADSPQTPEQDQAQPPETANGPARGHTRVPPAPAAQLAPSHPSDPRLARPLAHPATLLARLV
ncbi:IS701 family transposase, partial [Kitasatospora sp. NPDC056531]